MAEHRASHASKRHKRKNTGCQAATQANKRKHPDHLIKMWMSLSIFRCFLINKWTLYPLIWNLASCVCECRGGCSHRSFYQRLTIKKLSITGVHLTLFYPGHSLHSLQCKCQKACFGEYFPLPSPPPKKKPTTPRSHYFKTWPFSLSEGLCL